MAMPLVEVLTGLKRTLAQDLPTFATFPLEPLADTGLAHWHVRLAGTRLLARIPKQSQMQLPAADNLAYQRACFERASFGGHAPRLHHVLSPSAHLDRGALIVDEIVGRAARLPADLPAIIKALASIHALPTPRSSAPLRNAHDPLADLLAEVREQGQHLAAARLDSVVRETIDAGIAQLSALVAKPARPPKCLIAFDAHPGNFIVEPGGRAVLVDLEKARYAYPSLDLAHATLYTSTTWDVASSAVLSTAEIADAYCAWATAFGPSATAHTSWHVPLRRAMWLWSITWCAKWRALSGSSAKATADGEDWSRDKSSTTLIDHVRDRVDHYLSPEIVKHIDSEFAELDAMFATQKTPKRR
ncbi:MAG: hypothetical protein RL291_427 [Pseudomonadota bacterium]